MDDAEASGSKRLTLQFLGAEIFYTKSIFRNGNLDNKMSIFSKINGWIDQKYGM